MRAAPASSRAPRHSSSSSWRRPTLVVVVVAQAEPHAPRARSSDRARRRYLVAVPASDHCVHLLANRELWFNAVVGFLRRPRAAADVADGAPKPMDAALELDAAHPVA